MSNQKKLSTLSNNKSIIETFSNAEMSVLRKQMAIKSKETFQISEDREITVQNANFGVQGNFRVRETFAGTCVIQIGLPAGTYVLPANWGQKLIKRVYERVGGENETYKDGWANAIQTYRESENDIIKKKYDILSGAAVTNPSTVQYAYVVLNIMAGSINSNLRQLYPLYQLNQAGEFLIDFAPASEVLISGTAPANFASCRIFFEYGSPLRQRDLMPKFPNPEKPKEPFGEDLYFHELVSYEYPLAANGSLNRSVRLRTFPLSEYDEIVYFFTENTDINTNKNNLLSKQLTNQKLIMSDRELVDDKNEFAEMKALFKHKQPHIHYVGGVEKYHYVIDLTPMSYIDQEEKSVFVPGVILSEEDLQLDFDVPADNAGVLHLYGVRKRLSRFRNGNVMHFY